MFHAVFFYYYSISKLENLEVFDLDDNKSLMCIPAGVFRLSKLNDIRINGCRSLISPPEAVSKQGLSAMRKYFSDLDKGGKRNFIPVTVIGRSMAGKTSLIKTIQQTKRFLSKRDCTDKLDEVTKVFKVSEADFDEVSKLVFHDFGGQAIYHFAYPLSTRSKFIPMLVIDIAAFDLLAKTEGVDAACKEVCFDWLSHLYLSCPQAVKEVCFDWLSHLYLSCPQAGPPFIVLTHRDCIETLRIEIIKEEKVLAPETSPFFSMISFSDEARPLLTEQKLMTFYKGSGEKVIANLKNALLAIGLPWVTELPDNWFELMVLCQKKDDQPYLTLKELDALFPDEGDRVILQFLHEIGRVMWYKDRPSLASIVFHRIELLTKVVELLFDHTSEKVWAARKSSFKPFKHDNITVSGLEYGQMIGRFQKYGIMNSVLLSHIIRDESEIEPELAIEVLKVFHLVCGPIQENSDNKVIPYCRVAFGSNSQSKNSCYIIPYFSQKFISVNETGNFIPLKVDVCFNGLAIPGYVYHILTAIYVDFHLSELNQVDVGTNGACVLDNDGTLKYFLHNSGEKTVSLLALTKPATIARSWKSQLSSLQHLTTQLSEVWKGAHYDTVFYSLSLTLLCSHCLLTKQKQLSTTANPSWGFKPAYNEFYCCIFLWSGGRLSKVKLDSTLCLYQAATVKLLVFCRQIFI